MQKPETLYYFLERPEHSDSNWRWLGWFYSTEKAAKEAMEERKKENDKDQKLIHEYKISQVTI